MLEFKTDELGNLYLKEKKISLLGCNMYTLFKGDTTIGILFTGKFHSGKKYCSITSQGQEYLLKLVSSTFFKTVYSICCAESNNAIAYIVLNRWKSITWTSDSLIFKEGSRYNDRQQFGILASLWGRTYFLEMCNTENRITYLGKPVSDKFGRANLAGPVEIKGNPGSLDILLGMFWVDIEFRSWVRRNVD